MIKTILMDTHVFYWYINGDVKLPKNVREELDNADKLLVSAMACYELSWLIKKGKITLDLPYPKWFELVQQTDIEFVDTTPKIAHIATNLENHHTDPMDRIIIATALMFDCHLASMDTKFPLYGELKNKLIY